MPAGALYPGGIIPDASASVKGRVDGVDVLLIHALGGQAQSFAEALVVHHLPLAQEADDVVDVRVVGQAQDVVVGRARLLLCRDLIKPTFFPARRAGRKISEIPMDFNGHVPCAGDALADEDAVDERVHHPAGEALGGGVLFEQRAAVAAGGDFGADFG